MKCLVILHGGQRKGRQQEIEARNGRRFGRNLRNLRPVLLRRLLQRRQDAGAQHGHPLLGRKVPPVSQEDSPQGDGGRPLYRTVAVPRCGDARTQAVDQRPPQHHRLGLAFGQARVRVAGRMTVSGLADGVPPVLGHRGGEHPAGLNDVGVTREVDQGPHAQIGSQVRGLLVVTDEREGGPDHADEVFRTRRPVLPFDFGFEGRFVPGVLVVR
mmetsp:Transcript_31067/g.61494  ORF Transcript_31067/g.61494 Transcript_31067/m.61494 type:complete len:213 (-) Transcript_31067:2854-3492(-)